MSKAETDVNVGCENCMETPALWGEPFVTQDGVVVLTCECGNAEILKESQTSNVEYVKVARDESGRFTSVANE